MSGEFEGSRQDVHHFPGEYKFTVHPGLQHDQDQHSSTIIQKNVEFTFSKKLNCLFVKRKAICPFGLFTTGTPPPNSEIKIHVFSEDDVAVMRCRSHAESNECEDFIAPLHFMRCKNQLATYHCCEDTGKLSILLPYTKPESVAENVENFTFLCYSKGCIKKELFVKFSLINSNTILGHHVFGLHVCSTPGRDRMNHETRKVNKKRKRPADSEYSDENVLPPSQETYKILVEKPWIHEYLLRINAGLELLDAVPLEDQQKYLKKHRAKLASQTTSTCTVTSPSDTRATLRRILVKS